MRKFDIKKFVENKRDGEYRYRENDSTVVILSTVSNYLLETHVINESRKEIVYSYFMNGKLYTSSQTYCDVPVGITKWYNEYGELVKEQDEDAPYLFSMDDLRILIKKELKVDILYPESGYYHTISRFDSKQIKNLSFPNTEYYYDVDIMINLKGLNGNKHRLIIDATTGEILSHIDENGNELVSKYKKDTSMNTQRNWTPLMD